MTEHELAQLHIHVIEALNTGDDEQLQVTGLRLAENVADDVPVFHATLNALGYHNKLALINEVMRIAWPKLREEPDYSRPAIEAFAARATDHLIYAALANGTSEDIVDQALIARLETYFPVDEERLDAYVQLLSGVAGRAWSTGDFEPLEMRALSGLMAEFSGFAFRAGLPQARAHLIRELLPRYLLDRQAGNLQPKPDMAAALRQGRRPFPQLPPEPLHPLAPDSPSLKLFLERILQTVNPNYYMGAAMLEFMPHWLTFLKVRELLAGDVARRAAHDLSGLEQALASFWDDHPDRALTDFG